MTELYSQRLKLIPLNPEDLKTGIWNKSAMDGKLGLRPTGIGFSEQIKQILQIKLKRMELDKNNWLFYTFWQIVQLEGNCSVGEICFAGPPSANGEVEVGYYIDNRFQCRGYMTEALQTFINWAFSQPGVNCIKARTTRTNYASHKVLKKAGMRLYLKESFYWWVLRKQ